RRVKLIIAFREKNVSPSDIESDVNSIIAPLMENRSVPICYVLHVDEIQLAWSHRLFVMFSGSNVEASTFLVETIAEEKTEKEAFKMEGLTCSLSLLIASSV
ncbi:unnamed protein product, partial [Onchocerca ochengi]|uniref:TIR domain-containing protein n=1 Tax=Onchocerca ochengi TaxID=42157 RepID=A0A182EYE4_ONCOC